MIQEGWYCCPHCGKKLFKVEEGAAAKNIKVFCRHCKQEHQVNI